jgi:hypothetical protein
VSFPFLPGLAPAAMVCGEPGASGRAVVARVEEGVINGPTLSSEFRLCAMGG